MTLRQKLNLRADPNAMRFKCQKCGEMHLMGHSHLKPKPQRAILTQRGIGDSWSWADQKSEVLILSVNGANAMVRKKWWCIPFVCSTKDLSPV